MLGSGPQDDVTVMHKYKRVVIPRMMKCQVEVGSGPMMMEQ